jgi:hypothetical protein
MTLSSLLKTFLGTNQKRQIIMELIEKLEVDTLQKELYKESLYLLSDKELDSFYEKIRSMIAFSESRYSQKEQYNILLDNIS